MQIVMPRGELQVHVAKDNGILRDDHKSFAKFQKTRSKPSKQFNTTITMRITIFVSGIIR